MPNTYNSNISRAKRVISDYEISIDIASSSKFILCVIMVEHNISLALSVGVCK